MLGRKLQSAASAAPIGAWDLSYAYYDDPLLWDLSNARYISISFPIGTQETTPTGVFFKPDGTKMYVIGQTGDDINEYTLSTAWMVNSATYVQAFSIAAQETNPTNVFFKPDGTKMYVLGTAGNDVNEYTLSTAWDVSTASFTQNFSVSAQGTGPRGIFFRDDGAKMYIADASVDSINEYDLSTTWDVSTASFLQGFSVASQDTTPTDVAFKEDGTKMYMLGAAGDDINEYSLSTPWDVSTASYVQNFSVSAQDIQPEGFHLKPGGGSFYVVGNNNDRVYQYSVGGASVFGINTGWGMYFSPDGERLYFVDIVLDVVRQYGLSTAWDVSTASYVRQFNVVAQEDNPTGLFFKPDGTKMYVCGNTGDDVNEYSLSTAWNISTASYVQNFSVAAQAQLPRSLFFKPDGTKMYVADVFSDVINEYTLSTAWDISTASYAQNFSIAAQEATVTAVFFKPDGTKMYIVGTGGDDVNEYSLSTAWSVSTASYVQNFSVAPESPSPIGLFFKDDGTKMFIYDSNNDLVFTYSLGIQP